MSDHEHLPPRLTLPPGWSEDRNDMWVNGPGDLGRIRISYGTECNTTRAQAFAAAWGIAKGATAPVTSNPDAQTVVEDFELNYHVGSAVAALLGLVGDSATAPLGQALVHIVREQQCRGLRRTHEEAAHCHADYQEDHLRDLAVDIFKRCLDEPQSGAVPMLKMVLRGVVVDTFKESRRQLGLDT